MKLPPCTLTGLVVAALACRAEPRAAGAPPGCQTYVPAVAKQAWDGRSGHVLFRNASRDRVVVFLYHPDGDGNVELTVPVGPGASDTLRAPNPIILGNDWGIRVDKSCVELVGRVAAWQGGEFSVPWTGEEWRTGALGPGPSEEGRKP